MKPELKFAPGLTEELKADEAKGLVEAIISVETEDRDGDIVRIGDGRETGLLLTEFKRNPVVLFQHGKDARGMRPIGKATSVEPTTHKRKPALAAGVQFSIDDPEDPDPRVLFRMVVRAMLRAWSVRFMPLDYEERESSYGWKGWDFKTSELREFSLVAIPANALALTQAVKDGVCDIPWLLKRGVIKSVEALEFGSDLLKRVVGYEATPTLDQDAGWDAAAARKRLAAWASSDGSGDADKMDWGKYARGFLWVDGEAAETFGGYKLPHHDVADGKLKVNFRGCAAALVVLRGGRGGAGIPEADVPRCERHLAAHYKQFDAEFPEKGLDAPTVLAAGVSLDPVAEAILTARLDAEIGKLRIEMAGRQRGAPVSPDALAELRRRLLKH
ncbi:hypothetical protein FJY71_00860 [candidate division WOR-3 bacterium]|nr:hypothetical protein [candidate division WOR-3 bacterium]